MADATAAVVAKEVGADALTCDDFLGGRLKLWQPRAGYRAGLDAVLLAASVPSDESPNETPCRAETAGLQALDLGAGVGTVGLSLATRCPGVSVTAIERDDATAELASRNVRQNGLASRVFVRQADLTVPVTQLRAETGLQPDSFDIVLMNPPYHVAGAARVSPVDSKSTAHIMPSGALDVWVRRAATFARPGGRLHIVHRADALAETLAALAPRFGAIRVLALHPRTGSAANRILVVATKSSRAPLQILPPLVLHEATGHGFTPRVAACLDARAAALKL